MVPIGPRNLGTFENAKDVMTVTGFLQATAILLPTFLVPARADACACVSMGTPTPQQVRQGIEESVKTAEAVFSGEVISADTLGANLKVDKVWKGSPGGIARLQHAYLTSTGSAVWNTCDYTFEVGKKYMVFAVPGHAGTLKAEKCGLTAPLDSAKSTVRILDDLAKRKR
jgi:hypothetical protein